MIITPGLSTACRKNFNMKLSKECKTDNNTALKIHFTIADTQEVDMHLLINNINYHWKTNFS